MLRIAVPNKGTLSEPAAADAARGRLPPAHRPQGPGLPDEANDVEFFYLRPRDIATYVGSGDLDLGITGRDLLVDSGAPAEEVLDLGFGGATFRFAARAGDARPRPTQIGGQRIATAYPGWSSGTWPSTASRPTWSASTARWRTRSGSASPT